MYKRPLFIILALLLSRSVLAIGLIDLKGAPCAGILSTPTVFEKATELNTPLAVLGASVAIEIKDGSKCSGTYVSDEGHILLAAHCVLAGCHKSKSSKENADAEISCNLTVNGFATTAKIETAVCRAYYDTPTGPTARAFDVRKHPECASVTDLAVIKLEPPPENYNCLSLAKDKPRIGQKVIAVGKTIETSRGFGDADGVNFQLSSGEIVNKPTCESITYVGRETRAGVSTGKQIPLSKIGVKYRAGGLIQTTVDIYRGNSGGPLVNTNEEVIGVASGGDIDRHDDKTECRGATFFEPVTNLQGASLEWGGSFRPEQLKCNNKRLRNKQPSASSGA